MKCKHESVTVYSSLLCQATRYEPAEYQQWAECDECGERFDLSDMPDSEVSDEIEVSRDFQGMPHEFYD